MRPGADDQVGTGLAQAFRLRPLSGGGPAVVQSPVGQHDSGGRMGAGFLQPQLLKQPAAQTGDTGAAWAGVEGTLLFHIASIPVGAEDLVLPAAHRQHQRSMCLPGIQPRPDAGDPAFIERRQGAVQTR